MIQQRPTESDEDYQKRKRRVKLTMMGGLANSGGSVVLASIIYKMDTFRVEADSTRTIFDAGSSPKYHADIYGSNLLSLSNVLSRSFEADSVVDKWICYYDQAAKVFVYVSTPLSTYTMDVPCQNVFAVTVEPTTADLDYLTNTDPEAIAKMIVGLETIVGLSFDIGDVHSYYPCMEGEASGDYVQDVSATLGVEENSAFSLYYDVETVATISNISGISFDLEILAGGTDTSGTRVQTAINLGISENDLIWYELSYDVSADVRFVLLPYKSIDAVTVNGIGILAGIVRVGTLQRAQIYFDNNYPMTGSFSFSCRKATAKEIQNYNVACWTDFQNVNYGMTNRALKRDITGRITGIADANLAEYHGDGGYDDVKLMPPSDKAWEMDIVVETFIDGVETNFGIDSSTTANDLFIGNGAGDKMYVFIAGTTLTSTSIPSDGLHHISIQFDGNGDGSVVFDNTDTKPFSSSSYTYSESESFFLGLTSRNKAPFGTASAITEPIGYFLYTEKERTANERDADYATAKALHPTLP